MKRFLSSGDDPSARIVAIALRTHKQNLMRSAVARNPVANVAGQIQA
jgi:hypothetical protein